MTRSLPEVLGALWRAVLATVIALAARVLTWTLRVRIGRDGEEPDGPVIYAFMHGHQLPLLRYPRKRPTAALVSRSQDGSLQARVLRLFGMRVLRGSSSTGGAQALRSCLDWLLSGGSLALAVDGPVGPAGTSKPGVIVLAERARASIVPIACSARPSARLRGTWDSFLLPAPFARVPVLAGGPYRPWEKDWTDGRKLAYLDSLISDLANRAELLTRGTEPDDSPREHRWADRAAG